MWKKPPLDVYLSAFLFNITNAADFLSGKDKKVKYEQVGPYVYQ
jgi:scavenger receptor class B, member 1